MEARDLIAALIRMGMTQMQIAACSGMTQSSVSKVSRGDVKDVMSQSYRKLKALHDEVQAQQGQPAAVPQQQQKAA